MSNEISGAERDESSWEGYYRYPTVAGDSVVFVSEDDLWEVDASGGRGRRLTDGPGTVSHAAFSPDGETIAYTSTEEGATETFVMDASGGPSRQLTYNGVDSAVIGWTNDGEEVIFRSSLGQPFARIQGLHAVPVDGGESRELDIGGAHWISHESGGDGRVVGRYRDDIARWKRYRGGQAGQLWLDPESDGDWEHILEGNDAGQVRPHWVGDRIVFMSDHEGYGNLYSVDSSGGDLQRHTSFTGHYVRFLHSDGETVVFTRGGRLYRWQPGWEEAREIEIDYGSSRSRLNRKFVDASEYFEQAALHPEGHSAAVTARGKLFNFGLWEGAVRETGESHGVRYRLGTYLDDERLLTVSDESGEEHLEIHHADGSHPPEVVDIDRETLGRVVKLDVERDSQRVAVANHRHEVLIIDLEEADAKVVDRSEYGRCTGLAWSPAGRYLAYGFPNSESTAEIRLRDTEEDDNTAVTEGRFQDMEPTFDPEGRYLYFLSCREFNPVYDQVFFELSFPRTMKPCAVTLTEDERSPFFDEPRPLNGTGVGNGAAGDGKEGDEAEGDASESEETKSEQGDDDGENDEPAESFDLANISDRVEVFPVREAEYRGLEATADKVFYVWRPVEGSAGTHWSEADEEHGVLKAFSLESGEDEAFAKGVSSFGLGPDGATMAMYQKNRMRVVSAKGKGPAKQKNREDKPSRETGWIDLSRLAVDIEPREEWRQMLHEAWRLMRDHFWREDMSGVDWNEVWERYSPLLDRVSTRGEFSDLVWTMQGELGTSHAYEMGGDYERPPLYRPGFLGADVTWDEDVTYERGGDERTGGYRIDHIVDGERWEREAGSPLTAPGVGIEEGDAVVSVDGRNVSKTVSLQEALVQRSGREVELGIAPEEGDFRTVTVELLRGEKHARYREWVANNREYVHEQTDGEVGYIHIPDMGPNGYAEFHRGFLAEKSKRGLIVDVRYNGGGHVSQLILEKLARERIGYDVVRWRKPEPYPSDTLGGPMVALTNQHAGSDGDIFSHCFKRMDLGPLVGTRTWGGVVGIWPRHRLADGSMTTQPEFSFWFDDVEFGLENHGTEPDRQVEQPPDVTGSEDDPQLEVAIEEALERLDPDKPEYPDFSPFPNLKPPESLDGDD